MDRMDSKGVTQAALAEKIGTSPAYISKVMRDDANFTLETMTKLAMAVDGKIKVCIVDGSPMSKAIDTDSGLPPERMTAPGFCYSARRGSAPLPLPRKRG